MNLHDVTVRHFEKSLKNLEAWLEKAHEFCKAKNVDPSTMLQARLAIDQFPLLKQVQSVCDAAKLPAFRCAGQVPPKHPDTETTWDELRARIADVRSLLAGLAPADFDESRLIELPFFEGKKLRVTDYALEFGVPNFDFHLVTIYAILRNLGVDLGKKDFIGGLPFLAS